MTSPNDLINKAIFLHQQGNLGEAETIYKKVLHVHSKNFDALHMLGIINAQRGTFEEAEKFLRKALSVNSRVAPCFHNYGTVLAKLQRFEDAVNSYNNAIKLAPNHAPIYSDRGNALFELKRYDEALAAYDGALALKPNFFDAWVGRGNVFFELKRYDEAFGAYDKALALKPDLANAWLGRGNVCSDLKRFDEAIAAYDKALAFKPDLAKAWIGRGNVSFELKRYDDALVAYDKARALESDLAEAWLNRGNVFDRLNRHEEAAAAYAKVLEINPQHPFTKGMFLHQKMLSCDWKGIDELVAEIDSDIALGKRSAEPFGYQAIAHSAQNYKRCAEIYAADKAPRSQTPLWRGERYSNSKIRIGYLSGEFRKHVVSFLMTGLFELHDKNRFELFAIDSGWDDGSGQRERIKNAFDTIIDISRLDDHRVATLIKQKQIDILVNLNGYHGEQRNRVFSYKPSPIQINYLGFTATMGADYIDYIIADRYVIPPDQKAFYTEKVVYLPDVYQVNDTKRPIAERTPTRAELKLPDTGFVFCCFNNNFKITPDIFGIWMRVLNEVPNSVLWLTESNAAAARNLRVEAKHREISPERLVFAPLAEYSDYLARYRVADLFLDTLPFNAGATASDALWAGLPVLTCSGQPFTARMAGSLLTTIGLPELITTTPEAYEQMAIDLATHPEKLTAIKRKLAENRVTTPLFDTKLFTKHLEVAYTAMYERYQAGLAPDHIVVQN